MVAYILNFDNLMPKVNMIDVLFIFEKLDVGCFYHFGQFVRIISTDKNQTIFFSFWGNLWMKTQLFHED